MENTLLDAYLPRVPLLVVLLIGLAIAVKQRPAHPDVSQLAVPALTIMLGVHAIDPLLGQRMVSDFIREQGWGPEVFGWFSTIRGAAFVLLTALAWWLTLRAVWIGRNEPVADSATAVP